VILFLNHLLPGHCAIEPKTRLSKKRIASEKIVILFVMCGIIAMGKGGGFDAKKGWGREV
jgi:hypothetical protein